MSQKVLMIEHTNELHKCYLPKNKKRDIILGNETTHEVTIHSLTEPIVIHWDGEVCTFNEKEILESPSSKVQITNVVLSLHMLDLNDTKLFDITDKQSISFGANEYDDIKINNLSAEFVFIRDTISGLFDLQIFTGEIYYNFTKLRQQSISLSLGDYIFVEGTGITIGEEEISVVASSGEMTSKLTLLSNMLAGYDEDYPDYHRSPRIIYREPEDKKVIAKPSSPPSKPSEQIARTIIPPIVMIAALGLVSIFQPRGIYIVVMLAMTVTTIVLSVTQYVKSLKQYRKDTKKRKKTYKTYLQTKMKELYQTVEEQRHALLYHYPNITEIQKMTQEVSARTYEKTMFHHDFLMYRVGLGDVDLSFDIDFNEEEFTEEKDELVDDARALHQQFEAVNKVPIVTSLMNGPVGYIGQRPLVLEQLQLLVMQTALFHSYHDLQFVVVFSEHEKQKWDWMRWLPHAKLNDINVRGFVYHERSRDQVLTSFYQILKNRKQQLDEKTNKNEKTYFTPHYVVLVTDEKIILDHIIMEHFNEDPSELGVSLVFVQDVMETLPEHVTTVIDVRDARTGNVILEEGELINQSFVPDHFPVHFNKEDVSRSLAPLNHLQSLKSSIPESVTFLEMFGFESVEEFNLTQLWKQNETYKTMAVPLGLRGKDDLVYLNLHEKAHGPHGLVAGTTGSGKSEIIQSYILSLAVNFHPYEVAFLLIDYKGGGMANLFNDLPHLLGAITNLDGAQSMRALASIKAELQRRQRLFGEHDVNHINEYQKLYKLGEANEPMPHLFLISDEFAELKAEQPEFMKELVSTARIGRSLGIHLILATQKPSGVVDDQIWSNSKFKLALKVQDASDSNEILKTPDAAEITLPGRAYLQVGNNEIYELFQSAWSGADYGVGKDAEDLIDTTIYAINDLGQYDILTEDLSGLEGKETIEKTKTELEAVIDYVAEYTDEKNIERLPSPWLPPLKESIFAQEICERDYQNLWEQPKQALEPVVGFADFPSEQDQRNLKIPLTKDGHLAVFSSPGYGKSTFIQTAVLDLARTHNPSHLHVYLLDFGTNGLLPLKNLPHVSDTILVDENEKIGKLLRRLESEMKSRKKKLSDYGVATMEMYEKASGEHVPNLLVVIDNYDAVREADFADSFEVIFTQIGREGGGIGIHLIISAGRENAIRIPLLSNIKTQIALYMIDSTDVRSIVGRSEVEIEEYPGRGLIKLEEPTLFQTTLPAMGEDSLEMIENIQKEAQAMDEYWMGERPEPIPMMPENVIPFEEFRKNKLMDGIIEKGHLPLGLEFESVTPLAYDFKRRGNLLALADRLDRMEKLSLGLVKSMTLLSGKYQTMIIDTSEEILASSAEAASAYLSTTEELLGIKNDVLGEINLRLNNKTYETDWVIFISNMKDFCTQAQISDEEITQIYNATNVGIYLIICSDYSYLGKSYESIPKYIRSQVVSGLVSMRVSDQDLFKQRFISNEKSPKDYECYFAEEQQHTKVKLPK